VPAQMLAGEDLARFFEEHGQDLKGLGRNRKPEASLTKLVRLQVEFIEPETHMQLGR